MKIKELDIVNIGGIPNLKLENFNSQMNIICGPNGIGKTTIIDCIAHIFSHGYSQLLKKNVNSELGTLKYKVEFDDIESISNTINVNVYKPLESCSYNSRYEFSNKIIYIKTNRTFNYENLGGIAKDEIVDISRSAELSMRGISHSSTKSWFINKFVFSNIPNSLKPEQINNFELAKNCFSKLNKDFSFKTVDADSFDIIVSTPSGDIIYEYLSSGFKSIISIIFGIIREIEFRFRENRIRAEEFDGIVLVDEIELHLHPEWQEQVSRILKEVFPKVQFILTTHSPHVIQTALKGEVIALERVGNAVNKRDLSDQEYGYLGWTVEEVLKHVMGMGSLKTPEYIEIRESFVQALKKNNYPAAQIAFSKLEKMLHPENELIEIYKMQLISLGE
ncbi:AAA family ATPase [Acinetobacter nosocomialis]|uniref:AAA family ATPase n=1 Tax=Acinetobacter nosocomialis TaxID=106654 RepID=UPI00237E2460|nr:AAA family ATPase [Acinetobacter nosocomialis]MDE1703231.1 AAA family ATPase [Acinetobacter nosocomialis]HDG7211740.1 AAA family ATPase [Acinetobacter nosocomialis]